MTNDSIPKLSAKDLKRLLYLNDCAELALIDVREHGQYGEGHLYFAVSIPYSRLECEIERLVPRKSTLIVLYCDAERVALKSAVKLKNFGYEKILILNGGIRSWVQAGYEIFAGVNVPSKTFGEYVEKELKTPSISAKELRDKIDGNENIVVLDGRPYSEYQNMNIPGAHSCPNSELALFADAFLKDENTSVIINCAGRTRSIIGAQTLINLGLGNKVFALENGTQGWFLNDYQLNHGSSCNCLSEIRLTKTQYEIATRRAERLLAASGVRQITLNEL